ncbi:hypothetical protein PHMEG_00013998 [Phytophthora megakarya]|uniref:MULE transposase domain-containing protein n=1 Tax=Phytophthora megakarya TaxID=4795 RepID=A0A225W4W6_9STRA|nr:hypothetical protein PHMEG_00013998 [Phytophthora megakarya]
MWDDRCCSYVSPTGTVRQLPAARESLHQGTRRSLLSLPQVVGQSISVAFFMGDTDGAQYNALDTVFSGDNNYTHLMCYYHLIAKVVERTTGLPNDLKDAVFRHVYDLHYSRSLEDYNTNLTAVELRFSTNILIRSLYAYFKRPQTKGNKFFKCPLDRCQHCPNGGRRLAQIGMTRGLGRAVLSVCLSLQVGNCVHRLFAFQQRDRINSRTDNLLVYR